jgi:hypothetical protein
MVIVLDESSSRFKGCFMNRIFSFCGASKRLSVASWYLVSKRRR